MTDHYEVLGIPRDAGTDAIVRAWKLAANRYHPDKPTGDADKFRAARAAFDCLMDRQARARHDAALSAHVQDGGSLTADDYEALNNAGLIVAGGTQCPICLGAREVRVQQSGFWLRKSCPACT